MSREWGAAFATFGGRVVLSEAARGNQAVVWAVKK